MVKKDKHILKEVADNESEDFELLKRLLDFYWEEVYRVLTTTDHDRVRIMNLGTFTRKTWNLDPMIKKYENLHNKNYFGLKGERVKNDLDLLYKMKEREQYVKNRTNELKKKKKQYYKNLEE